MMPVPVERLLTRVEKPSRYLGGELNAVRKEPGEVSLLACLAFPDLYEVGMSHLGTHLLYALGNQVPGVAVERCYLPGDDLLALLKEEGLPLFTLESKTPLGGCDLLGITLQSELTFTNILTLLDAGKIPLRSADRGEDAPIVLGGGPCACNPEPLAPFFDLFFLGEAEGNLDGETGGRGDGAKETGWAGILALLRDEKAKGASRAERIASLKGIAGVYDPRDPGPARRAAPPTLTAAIPETAFLVPFLQAIHDRVALEACRGCSRGCRYCQAGMTYRPVREREPAAVLSDAERALAATGYEELSLLSLSIGDWQGLDPFLSAFMDRHASGHVAISLPSMRVGTLNVEVAAQIERVRRTTFTIAPEAGSERLRRAICKPFTDDEILATAQAVFERGWSAVKLYFMVGLPTETDADLAGIIELARRISALAPSSGHVTVNLSPFVPKPHTPFQWAAQEPETELRRKVELLRSRLKMKKVQVRWGRTDQAVLEAVLARGDRKVAEAVERAWRAGARRDGWQEHFHWELWEKALADSGLSAADYACRERGAEEPFPWDHLDCGVTRAFLRREWEKALAGEPTADCREGGCTGCGACTPEMKQAVPRLRVPKSLDGATGGRGDGEEGKEGKEGETPVEQPQAARRIRFTFEKRGEMRFLGHLEMMHAFERAARRSRIPLAFSRGFSPKPRLQFALSLPLGVEALSEWGDLDLLSSVPPQEAADRLNASLPRGLRVTGAWKVPLDSASLNSRVTATHWRARFPAPVPGLEDRCASLLARDSIPVTREKDGKTRTLELRPYLLALAPAGPDGVEFSLAFSESGSVKPHEAIEALLGAPAPEGTALTRAGLTLSLEQLKGGGRPGQLRAAD